MRMLRRSIRRSISAAHCACPTAIAACCSWLTAFIVAIFYCLDALYGERRDRSILFWKSLPVSDLTTVLSKASIPLRDSAAARLRHHRLALQLIMLLLSSAVTAAQRRECRDAMDAVAVLPDDSWCCSSTSDRPWRSGMRRSTAGCCWSPPGRGARHFCGRCCRRWRSALVEKIAFHTSHFGSLVAGPLCWIRPECLRLQDADGSDRSPLHSDGAIHSGEIPEQPGSVDRADRRRRIPRRCGPAAPLSGTNLISFCRIIPC